MTPLKHLLIRWLALAALAAPVGSYAAAAEAPPAPVHQTEAEARNKSAGCVSCHTRTDLATMHPNAAVVLGCTDCHGGNAAIVKPQNAAADDPAYAAARDQAHVVPRYPESWHTPHSASPELSYTLLNRESPAFVRFINPGDLRVAREACGACHLSIIEAQERSLMATTAMFWGGASYNNGVLPFKRYLLGEAYTRDGQPASVKNPVPPTIQMQRQGILPQLYPLPAWETTPPGDIFRVFERGGRNIGNLFAETGVPDELGQIQRLEEPGRPDIRQSNRGPGTGLRVAIPVLNITKTRLNDPNLWFLGTNDHGGDYRSSGCSACHVVYANDRDQRHSGPFARFGHSGSSASDDPTIPKNESGHPVQHAFTRSIPSSQCMVCHHHQPNMFMNTFLGYTMWDYESDAPHMWPRQERYPSDAERHKILEHNPEEAATRGLWGDRAFSQQVSDLNPQLKDTQFADYHGHGWNFRAVYKRDRHGALLDAKGKEVSDSDPDKFKKAVHLSSIHVDKGMHCVDCHFGQDNHGNGHIYGEVMAAIEITCQDCHGSVDAYPTLRSSGPAAPPGGTDLSLQRVPDGRKLFEWRNGTLYQRSMVYPGKEWALHLVKDSVDPTSAHYNPRAARAKLMSKNVASLQWGAGVDKSQRAHADSKMLCYTCHTSWTTSCAGCHLPIQANAKTERHHYEGGETRNFATYNPQVARDDMFQLGIHGDVKHHMIAPVRSTSALILSSRNLNRSLIYNQQAPISAAGYSSQAFAPHYPHTERLTETKTCTDCHLSKANDNNAIMAQLLLLGTNFVNFVGLNTWVGADGAIDAVRVTEEDEPQAVIGSYLHKYAYPDRYRAHQQALRVLQRADEHAAGRVGCLQLRGEYLYTAEGAQGTRVYDVASIANKDVSQRIVSSPFSPLGQDTHIKSKNATCIVLPTNQPINPARNRSELMQKTNEEQPMHPLYSYALITDAEEGLILVNVETLADGEPRNNRLQRALTWNDKDVLRGARHITLAGTVAYIAADAGIVVLDLDKPLQPRLLAVIPLQHPRASAVQFRYLFATDDRGLRVIDITHPERPRLIEKALIPLHDAQRVYVARTYAYVAADKQGLAIIDIEHPEQPKLYQMFTAGGALNDTQDVIVATTNASLYAYVADGKNGLKVLQLTSPKSQPRFYGFSPEPKPELIASYATRAPALSLSKGLDRDRAVDETGHQIAVFGRIGSRPFTLEEMQKLYLDPAGKPWFVTDQP